MVADIMGNGLVIGFCCYTLLTCLALGFAKSFQISLVLYWGVIGVLS